MKNLILSNTTTFKEAIRLLDLNGNGFLAVIDENDKLIGILTDGDVRRAVLNNKTNLIDIINRNPLTASDNDSKQAIILQLKKLHKKHMPIIDKNGILKNVVILNEEECNIKPNWVVIMAGGLGTRLGVLTRNTPKPMLKVGGKPMLEHIIEMFVSQGFIKFMISVNYKSEVIKNYFKDGSEFGIEIIYLEETKRLGTGGALSLIDIHLDEPFFVTNGDVLSSINYEELLEFHTSAKADATMCIREDSYQIPYGVINIDNDKNIINMIEKPINKFYINTGIYMLNPRVLSYIPKNEYFGLPSLFELLKKDNKTTKSFEISEYWIDMGNPTDYNEINEKMRQNIE